MGLKVGILNADITGPSVPRLLGLKDKKALMDEELCIKCSKYEDVCRFNSIEDLKINSFICKAILNSNIN
ncbi:P-loop NTPase [Clostridium sp.]|uniref:P-loop NTPase n=1 Tax=Clostridium sp. TaxID=1506 RepID=UPI00321700E4